MHTHPQALKVFSTCPPSAQLQGISCMRQLRRVARWSEDAGFEGMLIFTDNAQLDPWLVSQAVIESTERLCPLVAVQPVYMHPYSVAKMITTLANLHGRRVHLNMVAGGFKNDLAALGDASPHDERYERLLEYTAIIQKLLATPDAVTYEGRHYAVHHLKLTPAMPPELMPDIFLSGSSDAGMQTAGQLGATAIEYPKPAADCNGSAAPGVKARGIRVGIITRPDGGEAWAVARQRFPEDRRGQLTHQLAMKVSDSAWHKQLSELGNSGPGDDNPYWLVPFQNYKAVCPYLVGSYERVADEVRRYVDAGYRTFILDEPASAAELQHVGAALVRAGSAATREPA